VPDAANRQWKLPDTAAHPEYDLPFAVTRQTNTPASTVDSTGARPPAEYIFPRSQGSSGTCFWGNCTATALSVGPSTPLKRTGRR